MKSEHRHELQTNSLAAAMTNLPETLRKHSSRIMTVIALILVVVAVMRYRKNQAIVQQQNVKAALNAAWNNYASMERMQVYAPARMLEELDADVRTSVQSVLDLADSSTDRAQIASAYQVSGDAQWLLAASAANAAATQPSTTQPTTQDSASRLDRAEAAYKKIVSEFADQIVPFTDAQFGLAAIAENRRDWAKAREAYKSILDSTSTSAADKLLAENRLSKLDDLQKPLLLLEPPAAPVAPAASAIPGFPSDATTPPLEPGSSLLSSPIGPMAPIITTPTTQP